MSESIEPTVIHRLRHTPMRDLLRARITGRLDYKALIEQSDLPDTIQQLIARVVRRTRLWPLERVDVANELIAHFSDATDAGTSMDDATKKFGDECAAAKLIRRAKKRNRPLPWHVCRAIGWSLLCLILIYGILILRVAIGSPSVKINYVTVLNQRIVSVPPDQRAWPIYRQAILSYRDDPALKPRSSSDRTDLFAYRPGQRRWPEVVQFLKSHQQTIDLIRQGAEKPAYGFVLGADGDANDPKLWPANGSWLTSIPIEQKDWLLSVLLPSLNHMRLLANLVAADVAMAREERDAGRAIADITALIKLGNQLRNNDDVLVTALVALGVRTVAMDALDQLLSDSNIALSDSQLETLAHLLAHPSRADELISFSNERLFFRDTIQRMYTDNGNGEGHLTLAGLRVMSMATSISGPGRNGQMDLIVAASPFVSSRAEMIRLHDHFLNQAEANLKTPLWQADWQAYNREFEQWKSSLVNTLRYLPVAILVPNLARTHVQAERNLGQRDGLLVAIALEVYRHRNGKYPESLESLAPALLPQVPVDRITGGPLQYRLVDGRPLVYSVGDDRDDDRGKPPMKNGQPENLSAANWVKENAGIPDGDWVLYPQPRTPLTDDDDEAR